MEFTRNQLQDFAVQILTPILVSRDNDVAVDVEETFFTVLDIEFEEAPLFLKKQIITSIKYLNPIIDYVSPFLNKWSFRRLNYCLQAILILAIVNHDYLKETNKSVTIDVAVKLAKRYGDQNDYKFINAVLDNCLNERE